MHAGYYEEAQAWREWLLRAVAGSPDQLQIMYGIGGERRLTEWVADWLPGYEKSAPVRIGNAAHTQLQLDVFGEIMDVHYQARRCGLSTNESGWDVQIKFLEHLERKSGASRTRASGKCADRRSISPIRRSWPGSPSIAPSRARRRSGSKARSTTGGGLREEIYDEVCERGFDKKLGTFVQAYDSDQLDASLLMLPCVGFLPVADPRMANTVAAIERRLFRDGFVMRYSDRGRRRRAAAGRGRIPGLQLLAGRRLYFARTLR